MLHLLRTHRALSTQVAALQAELRDTHTLVSGLSRENDDLTAMLHARDRDLERLRLELARMTNAALARSMGVGVDQARDERGRFRRVG